MKQAAIFFCAFAVLFQIYSGAYASDSTSSASSDFSDATTTFTAKTLLAEFKAKLLATNSAANATTVAALEKATDDLIDSYDSSIAKLETIDNPTFADVINATIDEYNQKINTSNADTASTTAVLVATFYLTETGIITSTNLIHAIIDALAVLFTPVDSSEYGSYWDAVTTKLASVFQIVYKAFVDGASADLAALKSLIEYIIAGLSDEITTTTNIIITQIDVIKAIWKLITNSS